MEPDFVPCPGCGLRLAWSGGEVDERFNASAACRALYDDVLYYTLSLGDSYFFHQIAVDAYAAQHAGPHVKPITVAFALVGLYLVWERDFTGRQVQRAHMALAGRTREWSRFSPPLDPDWMTVRHAAASPNDRKVEAIREWSRSVWICWRPEEARIAAMLNEHLSL